MNDFIAANLPLVIVGAIIALVVLWWAFMATRRTRVTVDRRDTLDEGAAPASRNQALIDAPPVVAGSTIPTPPPVPEAIGGVGIAVAAAVEDAQIERAAAFGDDLTRIKGLGPKLQALLPTLGVTTFAQIASWDDAGIDAIDAQLGVFQGRIRKDNWVAGINAVDYSNTRELGILLYTEYLMPIQIAAAILLVAMIAAIALTLRERKDSKAIDPSIQVRVRAADRMQVVKMAPTQAAPAPVAPTEAAAEEVKK